MITIRKYRKEDEQGWVRCRILALLETTRYDEVLPKKPHYPNPSVQVVADHGGHIVGVLDIEYDTPEHRISFRERSAGGIIRTLAVLPEYQREKVAFHLMKYACDLLKQENIGHLEIWNRLEDKNACAFLEAQGFESTYSYLHFYAENMNCHHYAPCRMLDCFVMKVYGEYTGTSPDSVRETADRAYECALFEKEI
ncbi:MAG: GNAT family N-acetyltransferase [Oscillospiraceae bacterium]|nr:GNAT family N-acetyltransferase [Oscillospiraceae bacterium]